MTPEQKRVHEFTGEVARALGEKKPKPLGQIASLVRLRGEAFVAQLVQDTQEIEKQGGLMTVKGNRRRTTGGVFFHLARKRLTPPEAISIFSKGSAEERKRALDEAEFPPFDWEEREGVVALLKAQDQGEVSDVKIILQGRPQAMERRENLVILRLQHNLPQITMPGGVPQPDDKMMPYTVIVNARQYEEAQASLDRDAKDELYIEGFAVYDEKTADIVVMATRAITTKLERKERRRQYEESLRQMEEARQRKAVIQAKNDENRRKKAKKGKTERAQKAAPPRESAAPAPETPFMPLRMEQQAETAALLADEPQDIEAPSHLDEADAKKYTDLRRAEITYRQRIAEIESKPEDQRFGLETTQKLLTSIQKQIKALADQSGE